MVVSSPYSTTTTLMAQVRCADHLAVLDKNFVLESMDEEHALLKVIRDLELHGVADGRRAVINAINSYTQRMRGLRKDAEQSFQVQEQIISTQSGKVVPANGRQECQDWAHLRAVREQAERSRCRRCSKCTHRTKAPVAVRQQTWYNGDQFRADWNTQCLRCRKLKLKCSGRDHDGQECSNCKNSGSKGECQFLRINAN